MIRRFGFYLNWSVNTGQGYYGFGLCDFASLRERPRPPSLSLVFTQRRKVAKKSIL